MYEPKIAQERNYKTAIYIKLIIFFISDSFSITFLKTQRIINTKCRIKIFVSLKLPQIATMKELMVTTNRS